MAVCSNTLRLILKEDIKFHIILFVLLQRDQFALYGFRSPLLAISRLISFPLATEMFHFARFPLFPEQFGDSWFKGRMRLPKTYRSLPRPSSAK